MGYEVMSKNSEIAEPDQRESNIASLDPLSKWLDDHQQEAEEGKANVILLHSTDKNNIYTFEAAFLIFVLNGDIDLTTNKISNSNFYVVAPVWGRVNMMDNIKGNLLGSITCQFDRGPNISGSFTLSVDESTKKLSIEYDFTVKFVGSITDTLSLFSFPASRVPPSPAEIAAATPTNLQCTTYTKDHELFDAFLADHYDEDTQNILIQSYVPEAQKGSNFAGAGSKSYTINVSFLGIFELEGAVTPGSFTISATLYVRVPLWGRVKITSLSGSLTDGINLSINVLVAKGTVGFKLVKGKEVWVHVDLSVKFVGSIKDDVKLFTLPW